MWSEILTPKQLRIQVHCQSYPLVMESGNQCAMPWGKMKMARRKMKRAFWAHSSVCSFLYAAAETVSHQEYSTCDLLWLVLFAGNCPPLPRSAQSRQPWKFLCFERRDVLRELKRGIYWIPSWHTAVIVGVSTVDTALCATQTCPTMLTL